MVIIGLVFVSAAQPRQYDNKSDYPQDIYQLRAIAVQNRSDINNLDRRVNILENGYFVSQANATRVSVLEEQISEARRQLQEVKTAVITAMVFIVTQLVAFIGLFVRYLLDRTKFIAK